MARQRVRRATPDEWVERLGRAGLVARGVLYVTIGVLALQLTFGQGGATTGQQGAISNLATTPLGTVTLVLLAVGLAGYAVWRLAQAYLGLTHGNDAKAIVQRISYLVRGLLYAGLCAYTLRILLGSGQGGDGDGEQEATALLLDLPFGQVIVAVLGLIIIAVGLYQGYRGFTRSFREDLETARMSRTEDIWATRLGVLGLCARAVVFTLIGLFLIRAAIEYDPDEAVGLDGALAELAQSGPGPWLLGLVAAGLLAYGLFSFTQARYGRIRRME